MADHVGLIAAECINGEAVIVTTGSEPDTPPLFTCSEEMRYIKLDDLLKIADSDDALVMNPSFSSLWLGPRFPGFKLMYVQGYSTYGVLDRWFDSYVSASGFVCGFLKYVYGLHSPMIHPFIDVSVVDPIIDWSDRPADRVLVLKKGDDLQQDHLLTEVKGIVEKQCSGIQFELPSEHLPHPQFLQKLATYRYVLSLSCAEGFGLVPLESMALGATVIAFDAGGGRSYMQDQHNCWCTAYPNVTYLADRLVFGLQNPDAAQRLANSGILQGRRFNYSIFRRRWIDHLQSVFSSK